MATTDKLTRKQKLFVDEYLTCWNAAQAARKVGYTTRSDQAGYRLMHNPAVLEAISKRMTEKAMAADEVLTRLADEARANPSDFLIARTVTRFDKFGNPYDVEIHDINWDELARRGHLVNEIGWDKNGNPSIKLYNSQNAKALIGKYHNLWAEKQLSVTSGDVSVWLPADLIATPFLDVWRDIRDLRHMEYVLKGGRGSTKSSFTSLAFIILMVNNPNVHGLALRQVANTLRDSVYSQLVWAIGVLGLDDKFKCITSPLEIEYIPTGQKIYFRGADKPEMIKSIKPTFGHIGILWFEELDQFHGPEAIRKIEQSTLRGGEEAWEFKTYNPPRTAANWVNKYVQIPKANQLQHHSTYLDVPKEWLGQTFIDEAEHLKAVNPIAYDHEYLGKVVGTGGLVFENVVIRKITDEEIAQFDHVLHGLDWGYFPDPFSFGKMHYDAACLTLYIFGEYRANKKSNRVVFDEMVKECLIRKIEDKEGNLSYPDLIIADSAEPKSIADFREYGATIRGAEKGPDSVDYSMKWLQSLKEIVIDPERCPEHAEEFLNYELEQDKNGDFISEYPDKNNHSIDDVRYATNLIWRRRGQ